jgi:exopolyphosphatase/guanosine-5'-triphosphate,3'-diphosphate pyrophosphatase
MAAKSRTTIPIAVIDIGTNSALLLVVRREGEKYVSLHEESRTPRMGEGFSATKKISRIAVERLIDALQYYRSVAERLNAGAIIAAGTQIFRVARNADEVIAEVAQRTGIAVKVLSAEDEAGCSLEGALSGFSLIRKGVLLDVGGGSTELVLFRRRMILRTLSLPLGAVVYAETLLKRFYHISGKRLAEARSAAGKLFCHISREYSPPTSGLIAVGGTVTTLAALDLGLKAYRSERVHGHRLSLETLEWYIERFRKMTIGEIEQAIPFDPARARVLPAGTFLVAEVLKHLGANGLTVSHRGVRWGLAGRYWATDRPEPK